MDNYLILIVCDVCGYEEYFSLDNLPGGDEHCEYCSECCAPLPIETVQDLGVWR